MFDGKAFGQEIVAAVKAFLEREMATFATRIDAIETRLDALPVPRDGRDADTDTVRAIVVEELAELKSAIDAIGPAPELPDIDAMVGSAVEAAIGALPAAEKGADGASVTIDDVAPMISAEIERRFAELPVPKDGKDGVDGKDGENGQGVDPAEVERVVTEQIGNAIAAIPVPKDGADGRDGVGLAGAVIDRDGNLIVTLTNGDAKNLGPVVGRDGSPGLAGKDGRDGFNLEDFDAELQADGRTVLLSFDRGDLSYKVELGFPAMIYRGVFKEGEKYERGDTVTWAGSLWHCDADCSEKPGDGSASWTLAAKRGRDGRDGKDGGALVAPAPVKLR